MRFLVALTALLVSTSAFADDLVLSPANPQPEESELAPGLAAAYISRNIEYLHQAEGFLPDATPGEPLEGLRYPDVATHTLTSPIENFVIAGISGYMRFPEAGRYVLEVWSNDGISFRLGGVEVYRHDERHTCDENMPPAEVHAPEAGWYELDITYFQRYGTSCLMLFWQKPGDAGVSEEPVEPEFFAHRQ